MSTFDEQMDALKRRYPNARSERLPSGGQLVLIPGYRLPVGWQVPPASPDGTVTIKFLAPPGYPASQPDCFWVDPVGLRIAGGGTPQNSNDSNPIPGYPQPPPHGTWFSWHVQQWNPNSDSLLSFLGIIKNRLNSPR